MNKLLLNRRLVCLLTMLAVSGFASTVMAQGFGNQFVVTDAVDSVEIITGTSRRLTFDYKIPELWVENPEIIKASPIAPNEIMVTGLQPGISTLTVSDATGARQQINCQVVADTRKLERAISDHFPDSSVTVHALETGVLVKGFVARQEHIEAIMAVSRDYFPAQVINRVQINQPQQVAIRVKVYEVSRTKLRRLGINFSFQNSDVNIVTSVADLISGATTDGINYSVVGSDSTFSSFINTLEQNNVAKLLDQPTIVTTHGRPAEFLSGGEIPIAVASGLGTTSVEFRPFGTKLDIVPLIQGGGEMILEVRAEVSEVANDLSNNSGVPGFRVRRVNTGVKMRAGHTLALAGDFRQETETEVGGIPHLMDSSIVGPFFRRTEDLKNETELVFMITPRFVSDVDPARVPRLGPGQLTDSPSDYELYVNGYTEVPRCQEDCPVNDRFDDPLMQQIPLSSVSSEMSHGNAGGYQQAGFEQGQPYTNQPYEQNYNGSGYVDPPVSGGQQWTPAPQGQQPQGQQWSPAGQGGSQSFGYPGNPNAGAPPANNFAWPNGSNGQ
ncbi:MAG: pilus assembly protein N-terminal domain-containing protein [Planctomycetota bacterium]